jgi:hypothetical protein
LIRRHRSGATIGHDDADRLAPEDKFERHLMPAICSGLEQAVGDQLTGEEQQIAGSVVAQVIVAVAGEFAASADGRGDSAFEDRLPRPPRSFCPTRRGVIASLRCRMDAAGGACAAVWRGRQASLDAFSPPSWSEPAAGRKEGATRTQPRGPRCSLVRGDRPGQDSRAPG